MYYDFKKELRAGVVGQYGDVRRFAEHYGMKLYQVEALLTPTVGSRIDSITDLLEKLGLKMLIVEKSFEPGDSVKVKIEVTATPENKSEMLKQLKMF